MIGALGGGKELAEGCFTGTVPIVGVFAAGLLRAAFEFALHFARTEHGGGGVPIIEHQAVGYALADATMGIEAVRAAIGARASRPFSNFRRHDRRGSRGSAMPRLQCERVVAALVSPNGHIRIRRSPNFVDSSFLKFVF